ncbi:hypothetical protein GCM10009753_74400 [Streptantibioticus ferralitis]
MTFMNACCPGMKKKAADDAIPSIGSRAIIMPWSWPRGSSGGVSNRTSSVGTSGGTALGGRLTTTTLTDASILNAETIVPHRRPRGDGLPPRDGRSYWACQLTVPIG